MDWGLGQTVSLERSGSDGATQNVTTMPLPLGLVGLSVHSTTEYVPQSCGRELIYA